MKRAAEAAPSVSFVGVFLVAALFDDLHSLADLDNDGADLLAAFHVARDEQADRARKPFDL